MTPSYQEVAALVANLNMDAHLYARTRPEQSSRASQAADALTALTAQLDTILTDVNYKGGVQDWIQKHDARMLEVAVQAARIAELERDLAGQHSVAAAALALTDGHRTQHWAALDRIAALERECAELRKDAARLDWLADQHELERRAFSELRSNKQVTILWMDSELRAHFADGPDFRSAIDAAMTAKPTEGRT